MGKNNFIDCIERKLERDDKIKFWKDKWPISGKLETPFPRIFTIAMSKNMKVEEACIEGNGSRSWFVSVTRNLNIWEIEEYESLLYLLSQFQLNGNSNRSIWKLRKNGEFMVKSYYNLSRRGGVGITLFLVKQIWNTKFPPRIVFFAWETARGCILTIDKLIKRGKILVNRCYLCKMTAEPCSHILLWCRFVYNLWRLVYCLLWINWVMAGSVKDELWQVW